MPGLPHSIHRPRGTARRTHIGALALLVSLMLVLPACRQNGAARLKKWKLIGPSPRECMQTALSADAAAQRREALLEVHESTKHDEPWAIDGYCTIARLESDAQTRCTAIRALAETRDPRAGATLVQVLDWEHEPKDTVRPPQAICRWDAAASLATLAERGAIAEQDRPRAEATLALTLTGDSERHARLHAAAALGHFPSARSVEMLIGGLADRDFAVVRQCELSLVQLTGQTHDCDQSAWREWYEGHRTNLFAHAGEIPESRRAPYNNRFQKFSYKTRQTLRWLWPGDAEK